MPDATPSRPAADRNLLFGIVAVQMDFISRDDLIAAMHAWVLDKARPLGQVLRDQGKLAEDELALLDGLVRKHLEKHGNDPERSLAAAASTDSLPPDLREITDADVQASLAHATAAPPDRDPYATSGYVPPSTLAPHARFRILRPHAKGGLGEVFVARDEELSREVALKEIQDRHADHPESRARFVMEAEITGGLEHPGVVPVYGLGQYADGRPFYAMRFIKGDDLKEAIARFHKEKDALPAGERELRLRQLLGRFVDVCQTIAYAHSRGVLHRDLKPGNVMLGKYGETLVVDWGLAKAVNRPDVLQAGDEASLRPTSGSSVGETQAGTAVGTPAYMSPEQAAGRLDQLGPASDIYSLGATLYCLITGQAPVPDRDVAEVLRKVQKGDIVPPRQLRRDTQRALDAICRKAMALRPEDRYASALDLAADVEHFLADEPVRAWAEPWAVRARRWLSRRRTLVTTAAAALIVAVLSLAVASALLAGKNRDLETAQQRERQAREQTRANFALARQTVEEYTGKVSNNLRLSSADLSDVRRELLQAVVDFHEKLKDQAGDDPAARYDRARALMQLGLLRREIASPEDSARDFEQARDVLKQLVGADSGNADYSNDLATCHSNLGLLYHDLGRLDDAEAADVRGLNLRGQLVEAHPDDAKYAAALAASHNNLAVLLEEEGRFREGEKAHQLALGIRRRLAKDHPEVPGYKLDLTDSLHNLGQLHVRVGRPADGEKAYREVLDVRRWLVEKYPDVPLYRSRLAGTLDSWGVLLADTRRPGGAERAHLEALKIRTRLVADFPSMTQYQEDLAKSHMSLGNFYGSDLALLAQQPAKALEHYQQALALRTRLDQKYPGVVSYQRGLAQACNNLGTFYHGAKRFADAEEKHLQALRIRRKLAEAHPGVVAYQDDLAGCHNNLGNLFADTGRYEKAEEAYQAARAIREKLATDHPGHLLFALAKATAYQNLGRLRVLEKKPAKALEWFNQAATLEGKLVEEEPLLQGAHLALVRTYRQRADALMELRHPGEALADYDRLVDLAEGPEKPWARLTRARPLALAGQHARATAEFDAVQFWLFAAEFTYDGARVHALAAAAAGCDLQLPPAERKPLADKYAARAVDLLGRARAAGYFKTPAHAEDLKTNPDFAALGGRADFQKLLREVAQEARAP